MLEVVRTMRKVTEAVKSGKSGRMQVRRSEARPHQASSGPCKDLGLVGKRGDTGRLWLEECCELT